MFLSVREQGVIHYLRDHGVANYPGLIERFYANYELGRKRLAGLKDAKIIETIPFGQLDGAKEKVFPTLSILGVGDHWKKIKLVKLTAQYKGIDSSFGRFSDPNLLRHQLLVTVLEKEFKDRYPEAKIVAESFFIFQSHLRREPEAFYPDLVVEVKDRFRLAIECERTVKSKTRIEEKLQHYRNSQFSHVIYFCLSMAHAKSIMRQGRLDPKLAVGVLQNRNEVFAKDAICLSVDSFLSQRFETSRYRRSFREMIQ